MCHSPYHQTIILYKKNHLRIDVAPWCCKWTDGWGWNGYGGGKEKKRKRRKRRMRRKRRKRRNRRKRRKRIKQRNK